MRNIYVIALALALVTAGCNEVENTKPESSLTPAMISGATATGYNGGIKVAWTNPEDSRFGYVKIDYTDPNTQEAKTARAVYPATSWNLTGVVPADGEISFTLITVSEAGVYSVESPLRVSATSTLPPTVTDLVATPGPGRITLEWNNPSDAGVQYVELSYTDPRPGTNQGKPVIDSMGYSTANPLQVVNIIKLVTPEYGPLTFTVTVVGTNTLRGPGTTVTATALEPVASDDVTELSAVAGRGDIELSWVNPADDEISAVEVSYVDPREGSTTQGERITTKLAATATSYLVSGLLARYGDIEFTVNTVNVFDKRSAGVTVSEASELAKVPSKLTLTADMVYVNNSSAGYDGGGAEAMLDGDLNTYWHSGWSPRAPFPYSVVVRLPKNLTQMQFKATNRNHGNKYGMKTGEVWLGNYQAAKMTKVADITADQTDGVPARGTFTSDVYQLEDGAEFDTFRLEMLSSQLEDGSISFAEFEVYEIVDEEL